MKSLCLSLAAACAIASILPAAADPGVTDTSIKLGNTMPYSGPASGYSTVGRTAAAYFRMVNDKGGINGRTIEFLSADDAYAPPKAVEQTRKLVEQDEVFAMVSSLGTPGNVAVQKYLNTKKIPQLLPLSGASRWNDPKTFPWTTGAQPNYQTEGAIYARWILQTRPDAKIALIAPNDDVGRDYLKGFRSGLGPKAGQIVAEALYETTDPTIDSQVVAFRNAGADVFFNGGTPKFAAQALKKTVEIGWTPQIILPTISNSVATVLKPAGLETAKGVVTGAYLKDPTDKAWDDDDGMKAFRAFMKTYYPGGDPDDSFNVTGYTFARIAAIALQNAGRDLTREGLMKAMHSLHDVTLPTLLPGIKVNTSADNVVPIRQLQMARFDGASWVLFGDVLGE